jgi:hypothetical protein
MINEFSNLNLKKIKLKKLIKTKSLELDDLIELENELLLSSFDDIDQSNHENLGDEAGLNTTEDNDLILFVVFYISSSFSCPKMMMYTN